MPAPNHRLPDDTRRLLLRSAAGAAALPLLAPGEAGAVPGVSARDIVIGQSIALRGGQDDYGAAVLDGIQACLRTTNENGGVYGRQIVLRTLDDLNQPARAEANARQLAASGEVFLLFGTLEGGPCAAVMNVAVETELPFFGPMAGSPGLRRPFQPLVFPVRAEHRDEFRALLDYGHQRGQRRVGFLHADSLVGQAHLENVRALCKERGMALGLTLPLKADASATELAALAQRLADSPPELMFNHGSIGAYEQLIRMARKLGVRTAFMGVNSGSSQLAQRLGALAEGMVFTQVVPSPFERKTQATRDYQSAFRRAWPDKPFSYGSFEGWLTTQALVLALSLAGQKLTRLSFLGALNDTTLTLSGLKLQYGPSLHGGLNFVDVTLFSRERRFIH